MYTKRDEGAVFLRDPGNFIAQEDFEECLKSEEKERACFRRWKVPEADEYGTRELLFWYWVLVDLKICLASRIGWIQN